MIWGELLIRLMFADSDEDNIKNFTNYVKTSFPKIKNIVTLSDPAKNIIELVKINKPQLIVADIRFFGVSGIDVIRSLSERYEDIRFIVYGTYNDSEYIKKSLEFGVIDYMFKPIKPADFHHSLTKALEYYQKYEQHRETEKQFAENYKKNIAMFENIFVSNILAGHLSSNDEIINNMDYFNIRLVPDYTVFIVRIDHFKKIALALDEMEKQLLTYKIFHIVDIGLEDKSHKTHICSLNAIAVILGGQFAFEEIIEICEKLKADILEKTGTKVTIGIGRPYGNPCDIAISYREADGALRYKFNIGYNTVIPIQYVEPLNHITYRYALEREERLVYAAVVGEYDYCIRLLKELLDSLKQCEPLPPNLMPKIIMDILISMGRYATEQNIPVNTQFTTFFPSKEILELKTIDDAYCYLSTALRSFCKYILDMHNKNNTDIIEKAKEYLKTRYYENFNITKIAVSIGTAPEYLSKIFEDSEKMTLLEYTVMLRLDEAKRLMRETKFADDVIAVKVGYDDEKHYKSVFKQVCGMTIYEYRSKNSLIKP